MRKHAFIGMAIAALATTFLLSGCKKDKDDSPEEAFDRAGLLRDVANNVIVPAYNEMASRSEELATRANDFAADPDATKLQALRAAWHATTEQWMACEMFRFGAQYDLSINSQIATWPINGTVIESEINGSGPIDPDYIAATGTTRKGLSAIEYLLYSSPDDPDAVLASFTSGTNAARRSTYLASLCAHVAERTQTLANAWASDGGNAAASFASATQSDISGSLNLLVNAWIEHIEFTRRMKVEIPLGIENGGTPLPGSVENVRAQRSLQNIRASVMQWKAILASGGGLGIDDNLDAVNAQYEGAPLALKIREQIDACITACDAITVPLDEAVVSQHDAVDTLYLALKRLTVLTKLDMASNLGVIITFSDNDGD